jgi:hypothetical protein
LEDELQRKEEAQWKKDAAELGINPFTAKQEGPEAAVPDSKDEEVPGTPTTKAEPIIVTPKEIKEGELGVLFLDEQAEVSNLTAPAVAIAGPKPGASQEDDVDTVVSASSGKSTSTKNSKREMASVVTRASKRLSEQKK